MPDSDDPDFKYRLYEVTGASHDTQWSYVDYYQDDEDLKRIDHLPVYVASTPRQTLPVAVPLPRRFPQLVPLGSHGCSSGNMSAH